MTTTEPVISLDQVVEQLDAEGLGPIPVLQPKQLTTLDSTAFGTTFAEHQAGLSLYIEALAYARAVVLEAENKLDMFSTIVGGKIKETNANASKAEIDYALATAPPYRELRLATQQVQQRKIILEARVEALRNNLTVLSRFVTMRAQELEAHRTETRLGTRRGVR